MWVWISGKKETDHQGVYGEKGVKDLNYVPASRFFASSWIDKENNLYLFGGFNYLYYYNDFWKYDGTYWILISGSNVKNQNGVYGTKGVKDPSNWPGGRYGALSWTDSFGNFYLFGGHGLASSGSSGKLKFLQHFYFLGYLNDLWKFDGTDWIWISGSNETNQYGYYGMKGVADPQNVPGAREHAYSWIDSKNNLYLFGGYGNAESSDGNIPIKKY